MTAQYEPFMAAFIGGVMLVAAYYTVRHRDLVYSSIALALLGAFNAALVALLGFGVAAVFIVIVYVGAAVMFIIMAISMLGGGGPESRSEARGLLAASTVASALAVLAAAAGIYKAYQAPEAYTLTRVAEVLLSQYLPVLAVIVVALAATLMEAIAVARRGE